VPFPQDWRKVKPVRKSKRGAIVKLLLTSRVVLHYNQAGREKRSAANSTQKSSKEQTALENQVSSFAMRAQGFVTEQKKGSSSCGGIPATICHGSGSKIIPASSSNLPWELPFSIQNKGKADLLVRLAGCSFRTREGYGESHLCWCGGIFVGLCNKCKFLLMLRTKNNRTLDMITGCGLARKPGGENWLPSWT